MRRKAPLIVVMAFGLPGILAPGALGAATSILSIGTESATDVNGSTIVDVPVSVGLSGANVRSVTLQILYDDTELNIANSDVSLGSLASGNGWVLTPNSTPGKLIVSARAGTALSATNSALSGDILELNFHVDQGVSAFVPITFLSPTASQQAVFNTAGQNLASTTTFNNGGINAYGGFTWVSALSGSWSTTGNWDIRPPQNPGEKAFFGGGPVSPLSVSLDAAQVAGGITFSDSASSSSGYRLTPGASGTGSLTLNDAGSTIPVQVLSGSHLISAPVTLAGNLAIVESAGSTLEISGSIGQSTTAGLTLSGAGKLILSGSDSYTGGTTVAGGTLIALGQAALPQGGSLTVGANAGALFSADFVAASSNVEDARAEPVPEPGTSALAAAGLVVAALARRRKAKRSEVVSGL